MALPLGHDNRLKLFPLFPFEIADDPQLVRIAVAVGDEELAEHTIEQAERRCELNPGVVSFKAAAAHARGLWHVRHRDLQTAASLFATGPRPLATASALEDLGRLQASAGATDNAIASLDRALVIDAQAGASWDAARVRGRLRQLGVRRRIVVSERPATGWEALTSAEAAVAQLVSEGKTNREIAETMFISPHTVNTHLRHIFDKLGVNSRVSLTRMAEALRARRARPPGHRGFARPKTWPDRVMRPGAAAIRIASNDHSRGAGMASSPTVVLVHGAYADASGYAGVIRKLQSRGVEVRAPMNPLRSLAFDADAITRYATTIKGPIVLVGHSYGGAVISQAAPLLNDVIALVFLAAFALDQGESCASIQEPFPPPMLASAIGPAPTTLPARRAAPTCSSRSQSSTRRSARTSPLAWRQRWR